MKERASQQESLGLFAVLLLPAAAGLPLLGVWLAGQPAAEYFEFPPLTRYVAQAPFAWPVFLGLAVFTLAVILPFLFRFIFFRFPALSPTGRRPRATAPFVPEPATRNAQPATSSPTDHRPQTTDPFFPRWGWFALMLLAVSWTLAWTRFPWFAPLQRFTFIPLWLGYILIVQALTCRRTGGCLMLRRPGLFLAFFPASALFWWYFEYLNRFVQNWYYVGAQGMGPAQYAVVASLSFATVLPAMAATVEFLESFPRLTEPFRAWRPVRLPSPRLWGAAAVLGSAAGLAAVGVRPDFLFPLLWLAPLFLVAGWQAWHGRDTVFGGVRTGDWRGVVIPALAALVCGFFWEMWNLPSLAKWVYAVPFVNRFHIFEMPVLGYAGYLPFGLECVVAAGWVEAGLNRRREDAKNDPL